MSAIETTVAEEEFPLPPSRRSHGRAIASSTLWQVASQVVMAVLSVVTVKFVTIGLTKELVGYYNSAYGFLQTFAILADFGLYAVSVRELSRARDRERVFGVVLLLRTIILAISFGSALAVVWLLPLWRGTPFPMGVTIAAFVPVFTLLAGTIRTVFQVNFEMRFVFIAEVLQRIVTTAGIGLFILFGVRQSDSVTVYASFLWIGGIGALILFILSYVYALRFQKIRFCFDTALLGRMFALAAPYGFTYLLLTMYRQLDVVFIAFLRPDFALQNASYGLAGRVEDMAFLFPTFLLNSVLPSLSQDAGDPRHRRMLLSRTFLSLLIIGTVLFLHAWLWARPLTYLFATVAYLSTPGHAGADTAFALMSLPMFLNGIVLYSFYVFLAHHRWKRLMASFGVGVVLTILLNLLWTGTYGFVGAGSALVVVHILLSLVLLPQAFREAPITIPAASMRSWLMFSLLVAGFLLVTAPHLTSGSSTAIGGIASCVWMAVALRITNLHRFFLTKPAA